MPGLATGEILIGANGVIRVAPVGTAFPTDLTTAYNVAFIDLGYATDDGVNLEPSRSMNEIMAWQDFYPVRRNVTQQGLDVGLSLLQWNKTTVPFALGGGAVTTTAGVSKYDPPDPSELDERALSIEWADGTRKYRWHFLRVMVTDLPSVNVNRNDAAVLPLKASVMGVSGVKPWHFLTNDAAFA